MTKLQQAMAKAKAKYEAKGYSVTTTQLGLIATKGIYKARESWFENGQQQYIYNFKNGKYCGEQERWYENGQQQFICNFKNGKQDGQQEGWHENGQQQYIFNYKNDKLHGWCKNFFNGSESSSNFYEYGKLMPQPISKQISYAEYKAIQIDKFWNRVFWIGSIVLFVGLFLANSCFEIKLFD